MHDVLHHSVDLGLAALWAVAFWLIQRRVAHRDALAKKRESEEAEFKQLVHDIAEAHGIDCKQKRKAHKDHS